MFIMVTLEPWRCEFEMVNNMERRTEIYLGCGRQCQEPSSLVQVLHT